MPRAKKFLQRSMVLASRPRCWRAVRVRRCNSTAKTRNLSRSEEHTSELQSRLHLVCRLLLEKKKNRTNVRLLELADGLGVLESSRCVGGMHCPFCPALLRIHVPHRFAGMHAPHSSYDASAVP